MSVSLKAVPAPEPVTLEPIADPKGPGGLAIATYKRDGSPAVRYAVCMSSGRQVLAIERTAKGKGTGKDGKPAPDGLKWSTTAVLADWAAAIAAGLVTVD